jgi:hypothetical protein
VPPMLSGDLYDYMDRRLGGLVVRTTRPEGLGFRFEAARAQDRNVGRNVMEWPGGLPGEQPPIDGWQPPPSHAGDVRLNRPVAEGDYWLGRAEMRLNPSAGGISLHPGVALRLAWEGATGELDWNRFEAGLSHRRMYGRWTLAARGDAGVMTYPGDEPAPQALFELGTATDLPGFAYKEFVGDRAALARGAVMYTLPIFNAPIRLGSMWLPAPAPSPSVGVQVGWTDASPETQQFMNQFGWGTSDGARAALDLRLRFFGGSVSVGAARPLDRDGQWRFVWGLVGGL